MQEFGFNYEDEMLRNPKRTDLADVIVYIYDSSDTNSFSYISDRRVSIHPCLSNTTCPNWVVLWGLEVRWSFLTVHSYSHSQQQYNLDHIPTLFVATKSDLDLAQQVRFF